MNNFEASEFLHLHKTYAGFKTKKNTSIDISNAIKKDSLSKQAGIKKTSNAKKTTPNKIDAFFNLPKNTIDISIEARLQRKLKREFMDAKMKEGRRKKTIK